jgi:hypothetical protein
VSDSSSPGLSGSESDPESVNVAEMTRPKRDIIDKQQKDHKGRGRKRVRQQEERVNPNWKHPLVFSLIQEAQQELRMQPLKIQWSSIAIVKQCQAKSNFLFRGLLPQVLGRWIDRSGQRPTWSPAVLAEVARNGHTPGTKSTRLGILDGHVEVKQKILELLRGIRQSGSAITVATTRGCIMGYLAHYLPEMLVKFKCSDAWVRRFVFRELKWVMRKPTKASKKVPADADYQIENSFFRHVLTFREALIRHAAFQVNMDQTQVVYQNGVGLTFDQLGAEQISVVGLEEKRAFTLVVAISGAGDLLPFQAVFQGKTQQSVPSRNAHGREEAQDLGFYFQHSGTSTYWSNQMTMKQWVTDTLVVYWRQKMVEFGVPNQECLLQLDAWKVHRSKEFVEWMRSEYPWITLEFVPGGCTGLWQPCDVGIQRLLKHAIKQHQHQDVVTETLGQLQSGLAPDQIKFDTSIGCLRDRAVSWLVSTWKKLNKRDIVQQVCHILLF